MNDIDLILNHYYASNYIVLNEMYLNKYKNSKDLNIHDLKEYNPGHLGTSTGVNFLLSNLNYFFNQKHQHFTPVIGTGHSGASFLAQSWLDGSLAKNNPKYSQNAKGLNFLIQDFGKEIRSEINPQYPETIYDGGELGYSLAVSYGYALSKDNDIVVCIIGDGEAETGTLSASWHLGKILNTKSKVLPIINLNGLKMSSNSFLSNFTNEELIMYFSSLGYSPKIIDATANQNITDIIIETQQILELSLQKSQPLIIFKSLKGWGMTTKNTQIEGTLNAHKNPLASIKDKNIKLEIVRELLKKHETKLFDQNEQLLEEYKLLFSRKTNNHINQKDLIIPNLNRLNINNGTSSMEYVEMFLEEVIHKNNLIMFSPDEIFSNQLGKLSGEHCFEMLNENVLQGLMQGYVMGGNIGIFAAYEGFMPIISSMLEQYWKYLYQNEKNSSPKILPSLNYILTSICWENTYSHQNPAFIDELLRKDEALCNILFPKDGNNFIKCMTENIKKNNCINIITISKRCFHQYQTYEETNTRIEVLQENTKPDIILCATGDIMLKQLLELKEHLEQNYYLNLKVIYITNPKILDINAKNALTTEEFNYYFPEDVPCLYLFSGYPNIIKSFLYDRNRFFQVFGYNDKLSNIGGIEEALKANGITIKNLQKNCQKELKKQRILRREE